MNRSNLLPSIPEDFLRALPRARLHGFFLECAYVHRAGYLSWILTSIRPETRQRRIQQTVARLQTQRTELEAAARGVPLAEIRRPAVIVPPQSACTAERRSA
jgi:hypothetical protein